MALIDGDMSFNLNEMEAELKRTEEYLSRDVFKSRKGPTSNLQSTGQSLRSEEQTKTENKKDILKNLNRRAEYQRSEAQSRLANDTTSALELDLVEQEAPLDTTQSPGGEIGRRLKSLAASGSFGSPTKSIEGPNATLESQRPQQREDRDSIVNRLLKEREERLKQKLADSQHPKPTVPEEVKEERNVKSFSAETEAMATSAETFSSDSVSKPRESIGPGGGFGARSPSPFAYSQDSSQDQELFFASDIPTSNPYSDTSAPRNGLDNMGAGSLLEKLLGSPAPPASQSRPSDFRKEEEPSDDAHISQQIEAPDIHSYVENVDPNELSFDSIDATSPLERGDYSSGKPLESPHVAWQIPEATAMDAELSIDSIASSPQHEPTQNNKRTPEALELGRRWARPKGARIAELQRQAEERFLRDHTFQPRTNEHPPPPSRRGSKGVRRPNQQRLEELAKPRLAKQLDKERLRLEKEKEELDRYCTFKPRLTKKAKERLAEYGRNPRRASERLYRDAIERDAFHACAKYHLEEAKMKECSFQPQTNRSRFLQQDEEHRPIHERAMDVQREREQRLWDLRAQQEAEATESGQYFVPQINQQSNRIAREILVDEGSAGLDVGARLYRASVDMEQRRMDRLQQHEEEQAQVHHCGPYTNLRSNKLAESNPDISKPFLERQKIVDQRYQEREQYRQEKKYEEEKHWFTPSIGRSGDIINKKRPDQASQSIRERVARLNKDAEIMENKREQKAQEDYAKLEFKPQINKVSQLLGRASCTEDLVQNFRGKHRKEKIKKEEEERFQKECTFQPKLVSKSISSKSDLSAAFESAYGFDDSKENNVSKYSLGLQEPWRLNEKLKERQQKQERRIQEHKLQKEIEEMSQCTFQPQTKSAPKAQGRVIVRGLGRHMELQDLKRRYQQEQQQREIKAFSVRNHDNYRASDGTTEFQPFEISSSNLRKKEKTAQEAKKRFDEAHTFQPKLVAKKGANHHDTLNNFLEASSIAPSDLIETQDEYTKELGTNNDGEAPILDYKKYIYNT